jgi:hypothetical protein
LIALADLAPEDPAVLDCLVSLAKDADGNLARWTLEEVFVDALLRLAKDPADLRQQVQRSYPHPLLILADIGLRHPSTRKEIVPVLIAALEDRFKSPGAMQLAGFMPNLVQWARCLEAIQGLACIGPEAKAALPALKKLKLHEDETVRKLASRAVEQISQRTEAVRGGAREGPKSWAVTLKAGQKVAYEIRFLKDGPAMLWLDGDGNGVVMAKGLLMPAEAPPPDRGVDIHITDSAGNLVVQESADDDHALVGWQPAAEATYRIEIHNRGSSSVRCRLKHN